VFRSVEHVRRALLVVLPTEFSMEPSVRSMLRQAYGHMGSISTRPTAKGVSVITPFSEYFGLHYIDCKPLREFYVGEDRTLFIRMVEAERMGLITITINPPLDESASRNFNGSDPVRDAAEPLAVDWSRLFFGEVNIMVQFMPSKLLSAEANVAVRESWDSLRLKCIQSCVQDFLFPTLVGEVRRELVRIGKETIVEQATANFGKLLSVGPYMPPYQDSRERVKDTLRACPFRPFYATVVSIFVSVGRDEPLCMAYVNSDGVLRAHDYLPAQALNQKSQRIRRFLVENKPDLIVVNASGGAASRSTCTLVEKNILREVEEEVKRRDAARRESRLEGITYADDDVEYTPYTAQVMLINDDLATIFKNSHRSKKMFPELQPLEAAAVSLARFAQEPLAEYCSTWAAANAQETFGFEMLFLNLHPLKV
jgi:transcription elongation factor SPT6